MKLDILAIGVHPDDVELGCAGTLLKHIELGYKVGILDLTKGELGTRGTAFTRKQEAEDAANILGVALRENLGFEDGFFNNDKHHQIQLIQVIRKYRPEIIFTNAKHDRHPDHGKAAALTNAAVFLSGLPKIETTLNGVLQEAFRPKSVYNYIQAIHIEPDFVVDITPYFDKKMEAVLAYKTQFHNPDSNEKDTFISSPEFLDFVKGRAVHFGVPCGMKYAEGFNVNRTVGVDDVMQLR